jgi:DNA replication protein DnaC
MAKGKTSSLALIGERVGEVLSRQDKNKNLRPWLNSIDEDDREAAYLKLASTVGARYAGCTLENYVLSGNERQKYIYDCIVKYAENMEENIARGSGIIMFGRCGTGKDHLVAALLYQAVLMHGFSCAYERGTHFFESLRSAIGDGVSEKEVIRPLERPLVLCLSDPVPSVGPTSNFQTDALFRLIDSRYRQNKITFATLNVDNSKEASERLSAQIIDRLSHNALALSCDWPSYRREGDDAKAKTI